ncbi:hypothetical protein ACE8GQ_17670, partial [Xanthomonas euvesicatoria pv. euvesicatoria]|uniref:hypothetical protein n=1 Tax=Xanthomonas euvesicatoria TaxID=456327 RepID=UPI003B66CFA8
LPMSDRGKAIAGWPAFAIVEYEKHVPWARGGWFTIHQLLLSLCIKGRPGRGNDDRYCVMLPVH